MIKIKFRIADYEPSHVMIMM